MSPEEAARGGRVVLRLPVRIRCPRCGGHGWAFFCPTCGGTGAVGAAEDFPLDIAPGIADGTIFALWLSRADENPVLVRVRVVDR
jgi:DnaJ-class molecular chaperone